MGCLKCIRTTAVELEILMKKTTSVAGRFCSIANRAMSQLQGGFQCEGFTGSVARRRPGPCCGANDGIPTIRTEAGPKILFGKAKRSRSHKEQTSTYLSVSQFQRHQSESIFLDVTAEVCEGLTRGRSSRRTWSIHIVKMKEQTTS